MGMTFELLAIPESLTPTLATILRESGIEVQEQPDDERDDSERFLMCLVCTDGRSSVALSVQREPHVNGSGPVAVIGPPPKEYQKGKFAEFSNRISQLLQDHGAWIPKRQTAT